MLSDSKSRCSASGSSISNSVTLSTTLGDRALQSVASSPRSLPANALRRTGRGCRSIASNSARISAPKARRIGRAADRAHRGAGNDRRLDAQLVERLQHQRCGRARAPIRRRAPGRCAGSGPAACLPRRASRHASRRDSRGRRRLRRRLDGRLASGATAGSVSTVWLASTRCSWRRRLLLGRHGGRQDRA